MKKAVFLDRLNRKNLGARTTCKALISILKEADVEIIKTFDNDFANNVSRSMPFEQIAYEINNLDTPEVVSLIKALEEADYFIINGEGSMIFSIPRRKELGFHYAMIFLAKQRGCKTFYINSIVSAGGNQDLDCERIDETKRFLKYCDEFIVRDILSYDFAKKYLNFEANYIPEALFYFAAKYSKLMYSKIHFGDMLLPFPEDSFMVNSIQIKEPYIAISGSSGLSGKKMNTQVMERYVKLVEELKRSGNNILLVKTCDTENYLDELGRQCSIPVIACENNFVLLYWVLVRSKVFISGRFHPSILASGGGVPCILLSSNSHKSEAFYTYFYFCRKKPEIISASLSQQGDIEKIVERCSKLRRVRILRKRIKKACMRNGNRSKEQYIALFKID